MTGFDCLDFAARELEVGPLFEELEDMTMIDYGVAKVEKEEMVLLSYCCIWRCEKMCEV